MPFNVPDGYFEGMKHQVMDNIGSMAPDRIPAGRKPIRYIILQTATAAAMLAAAVTGSISFISSHIDRKKQMLDDTFFYTELMPNDTDVLYDADSYGYVADSDISDEDIIDYLIYSGIPVEQLNESDYE